MSRRNPSPRTLLDEYGRRIDLQVGAAHKPDCIFGTGFYRIQLIDGGQRYCQDEAEVKRAYKLLAPDQVLRVDRDGYCLDGYVGDANTPDVVDAEQWLAMPREQGMRELGLESEADYARCYRDVEQVVHKRDNRAAQGGVRPSIVIKRKGRPLIDVLQSSESGAP
jgi:hypothetical protein